MDTNNAGHELDLERFLWVITYAGMVQLHALDVATKAADDAVDHYRLRWLDNIEVPKGMDPELYRNFRIMTRRRQRP